MPGIRTGRPAGDELRHLWQKSLAGLIGDLAPARRAGGVHGFRKRLKVLRGQLHLIRFAIGSDAFDSANAALGEAAEAFAGARRAEALQEAIAKLGERGSAPDPALAELSALARRAHEHNMTAGALEAAAGQAQALLESLQRRSARWRFAKRDPGLYLDGMRAVYGRARQLLAKGLASGDMATLHDARKSVIRHLHQLETVQKLWPELMQVWTAELNRLREALGDLNDLDELDRLIAAEPTSFSTVERRDAALAAIAGRRRQLVARVKARFNHLFAEKPKAFGARIGAMWHADMA